MFLFVVRTSNEKNVLEKFQFWFISKWNKLKRTRITNEQNDRTLYWVLIAVLPDSIEFRLLVIFHSDTFYSYNTYFPRARLSRYILIWEQTKVLFIDQNTANDSVPSKTRNGKFLSDPRALKQASRETRQNQKIPGRVADRVWSSRPAKYSA